MRGKRFRLIKPLACPTKSFRCSHTNPPTHSHTVRARFTLIELLVVIAIIAILAAMLLPVLQRSKQHAHSAVCINNQRNLFHATVMFSLDRDGWIPHVWGSDGWGLFMNPGQAWLANYGDWDTIWQGSTVHNARKGSIAGGTLAPYLGLDNEVEAGNWTALSYSHWPHGAGYWGPWNLPKRVMNCPAIRPQDYLMGAPYTNPGPATKYADHFASYGLNQCIAGTPNEGGGLQYQHKFSGIKAPAEIYLLGDKPHHLEEWGWLYAGWGNLWIPIHMSASAYNETRRHIASVFTYVDGHAESVDWAEWPGAYEYFPWSNTSAQ